MHRTYRSFIFDGICVCRSDISPIADDDLPFVDFVVEKLLQEEAVFPDCLHKLLQRLSNREIGQRITTHPYGRDSPLLRGGTDVLKTASPDRNESDHH